MLAVGIASARSETIFSDTFESSSISANSWIIGPSSSNSDYQWDIVIGPNFDQNTHGGTRMAFCNGYASGYPLNYNALMDTSMSRTVDLRAYSDVGLSFWFKIPSLGTGERCSVFVLSAGVLDEVFYRTVTVNDWTQSMPNISAYAGKEILLIFRFQSDATSHGIGWFVDDIVITGTPAVQTPPAPSNLSKAVSTTVIALAWSDNSSNESGFRIERKSGSGSFSELTTTGSNIAAYNDYAVSQGVTYTYRVQAYNGSEISTYSNEVSATLEVLQVPSAPSNLAVVGGTSHVAVAWSDNSSNETGFKIERKSGSGSYSQIATTGASVAAYNDQNVSQGVEYTYRVRAYNNDGDSSYTDEKSATLALSAPQILSPGGTTEATVQGIGMTPTMKWNAVAGAASYVIRISKAPYGSQNIVGEFTIAGSATEYTIPSQYISAGITHRWDMTAKDAAGNESTSSDNRYITISYANLGTPALVSPGAATSPGQNLENTALPFQWAAVSGAARYGVFIEKSPYNSPQNVAYENTDLSGTSLTLPLGTLQTNQLYRWRVLAYDASGLTSVYSSPLYFVIQSMTGAAPKPVISTPTGGEIFLNKKTHFIGSTNPASDEVSVVSWKWTFSDSSTELVGKEVSRTFVTGTVMTATLTVTDASGRTDSTARTFQLKGAGDPGSQKTGTSLDPVNLATGNFVMDAQDLSMPGRGLPFVFQRFYNSKGYDPSDATATPGPLGWGWSHNFEIRVLPALGDNSRLVLFGDGHTERFARVSETEYAATDASVQNIFAASTNGTFSLTSKNQVTHLFEGDAKNGSLKAIKDRNNNQIIVNWDEANFRIASITDTVGRTVSFEYDTAGHLKAMSDSLRRIEYTVDANHDLTAVKNAREYSTAFTYDSLHQLQTGTDPKGQQFVQNVYRNSDRTISEQNDASNAKTTFDYHFDATPLAYSVVTREGDGGVNEITTHYHDAKLRLKKRTDGRGDSYYEEWDYTDATGDCRSYRDKNGNAFAYEFDARSNLTRVTNPDGGITTVTYNDRNDPVLTTNAQNVQAFREYDTSGNLKSYTFPYDSAHPDLYKRSQTVNAYGQVETTTDANGHITKFFYDSLGNNDRTEDAEANTVSRGFDAVGRRTSDADGLGHTTGYALDENGNITTTTFADTTTIKQTFDENDNRASIEDQLHRLTQFSYDAQDRLVKTTDVNLNEVTLSFDKLGRNTSVVRPGPNGTPIETWMEYDLASNLTKTTETYSTSVASLLVTTFEHDGNGNVTKQTDADGIAVRFAYDPMNRRTKVTNAKNEDTSTNYNPLGQVTSVTDGKGNPTSFEYNPAGQRTKLTDAATNVFTWGFDFEGNQTSATHALTKTRTATYFKNNLPKTATDELGNPESREYDAALNLKKLTNAESQVIDYGYDTLNRLTSVGYPSGPPTEFTYYSNGLRHTMTDAVGTTIWTYTNLNQVETVTDPYSKALSFTYTPSGGRKTITYPGNKTVTYGRDSADRLVSMTDWMGRTTTREYTSAGRDKLLSRPNGQNTSFGHDTAGRMNNVVHRRGTDYPLIQFSYFFDKAGNVTDAPALHPLDPVIPTEEISYTYGDANQITGAGSAPFTHDLKGNILSGKLSASGGDSLVWDFENRLTASTIGSVSATHAYNGLGHRLQTTRNGETKRFVVDGTGPLAQIMAETDGTGTISAYYLYFGGLSARILPDGTPSYYHTDRSGSVVALTDATGSIAALYQYDPFGVPAGTSGTSTNPFRYLGGHGVYDDGDGTLFARARFYHSGLGRFLSRDPLMGNANDGQSLNRYVYGLNNPLGFIDASGLKATSQSVYLNPYEAEAAYWQAYNESAAWMVPILRAFEAAGVAAGFGLEFINAAQPLIVAYASPRIATFLLGPATFAASGNSGKSGIDSPAPRTLFHYTNEKGLAGILESGELRPSLWKAGTKDVRYGNGQYFSDILPGSKTSAQLSRDFLGQPFHGKKFTHFIEVDVSDLTAIKGRDGVFVIPNETSLNLTGRIIRSGAQ